jgi:hypothetical protein
MILSTLREADQAISAREIVMAVIAKGGHEEAARRALSGRIRGNLAYLQLRSVVLRIAKGGTRGGGRLNQPSTRSNLHR